MLRQASLRSITAVQSNLGRWATMRSSSEVVIRAQSTTTPRAAGIGAPTHAAAAGGGSGDRKIKARALSGELAAYGLDPAWVQQKRREGISINNLEDAKRERLRERREILSAVGLDGVKWSDVKAVLKELNVDISWVLDNVHPHEDRATTLDDIRTVYKNKLHACTSHLPSAQWSALPSVIADLGVNPDWLLARKQEGLKYSDPDTVYNVVLEYAGLGGVERGEVEEAMRQANVSYSWLIEDVEANGKVPSLQQLQSRAQSHQEAMSKAISHRLRELLALNVPVAGRTVVINDMLSLLNQAGFGYEWVLGLHKAGAEFTGRTDVISHIYLSWGVQAGMSARELMHLLMKMDKIGVHFAQVCQFPDRPAVLRLLRSCIDWLIEHENVKFETMDQLKDLVERIRNEKLTAAGLNHLLTADTEAQLDKYGLPWQWLLDRQAEGHKLQSASEIGPLYEKHMIAFHERSYKIFGHVQDPRAVEQSMKQLGVDFDWIEMMRERGYTIEDMDDVADVVAACGTPTAMTTHQAVNGQLGLALRADQADALKRELKKEGGDLDEIVKAFSAGAFDRPKPSTPPISSDAQYSLIAPPVDPLTPASPQHPPLPTTPRTKKGEREPTQVTCHLGGKKAPKFDILDVELMSCFITETGRIQRKTVNKVCTKKQHELARKIKLARHLGLLPHLRKHPEFSRVTKHFFAGERLGHKLTPNPQSNHPEVTPWWRKETNSWARFLG